MKKQNIRRGILLLSFMLFPATFYYLSPVLILQGASEGIINGSFIAFTLLFLSSFLFGRSFCGWVCPAGGLQECFLQVANKRAKGKWRDFIKYFIWVPWIAIIFAVAISSGGYRKIEPLYQTEFGLSITSVYALIIYLLVLMVIAIPCLTSGKRAFCHYFCWMAPFMIIGTKLRNLFKYSYLHLEVDAQKCTSCKSCTKKCPMSLEVDKMVMKGDMRNAECILCGECIDACPKGVIKYSYKHTAVVKRLKNNTLRKTWHNRGESSNHSHAPFNSDCNQNHQQ